MTRGQKHHYIPKFYLKQWAGPDEQICEFSRPYQNVEPRRTHPDGTGYERGLYRLEGYPSHVADMVETALMKNVDDEAARSLVVLRAETFFEITELQRFAWARFVISLMRRTPEAVRSEHQLRTMEENPVNKSGEHRDIRIQRQKAILMNSTINNEEHVRRIAAMQWAIFSAAAGLGTFLTSDRPLVMTNGIAYRPFPYRIAD